ncbi:hypothetical protein K1719_026136 [Acacia pycnantha]|nr:hypothetical protein K1719_026136 [Acacia pycnantha]
MCIDEPVRRRNGVEDLRKVEPMKGRMVEAIVITMRFPLDGVAVDPNKVDTVLKWEPPKPVAELAAVVFALKIWRRYLYGSQFEILSSVRGDFDFYNELRMTQMNDDQLLKIIKELENNEVPGYDIGDTGILRYKKRICVPNNEEIKKTILE